MSTKTKLDIAETLANRIGLSISDSKSIVADVFEEIAKSLEKGNTVKISDFGSFELREKNPRMGRNPKTGEVAEISARTVISFRPSEKMKK